MAIVKVFVGLDYHDDFVQVCVMNLKGKVLLNRKLPNDWQAIAAAVKKTGHVAQAAIEACNGAAHVADELISRARWPLDLSHPGYVARMKGWPPPRSASCVAWRGIGNHWSTNGGASSCASAPCCESIVYVLPAARGRWPGTHGWRPWSCPRKPSAPGGDPSSRPPAEAL
jgi:hypothetical protein